MTTTTRDSRQQALQLMCFLEARPDLSFEQASQLFEQWFSSIESEETLSSHEKIEPNDYLSAKNLVQSTLQQQQRVDFLLQESSHHWRLERMSWVDRNLLRLAIYELLFLQTPPKMLINEAVELAKKYGSSSSSAFINGILDSIYRKHVKKSNHS